MMTSGTSNYSTPAPTAIGNFTTPAPTAIGNFTTPAPTAIGNFTTPAPTAIGNFTTPAPTLAGNFSTPSPTLVGNFSAGNSTTGNFTSGNVSMAGDEAMGVVTVSIAGSATLVQTPAPAGQAPESESDPTKTLNITGCLFSENTIDGGDEGDGEDGELFGGTVVAKWGVVTIDDTMFYNNKGTTWTIVCSSSTSPAMTGVEFCTSSVWRSRVISPALSLSPDEGAFVIQNGFESCSSVTFLTTLESGPELSGARFSDTGASMLVTFAQDTDYGAVADLGGSFDCPLLLDYPGGSDADVCSWTSAASIQVTLHYNASVVPSDVISTLANKVALSTSPESLNAESSVTISPPENPPQPQLVPEVWYTALAHCKDLVLDVSASTGGGGRVMESYQWELYDWTVEQESDAPSAEFDYAEEASAAGGSSKLTIPGAGRESENELTWYFNITATNWLGGTGWTSIEVLVSAAAEDPPLLSLAGGATRTVLRAASLAIVANAEVENCVTNKTSELTYEWSELRTGGTFTSTSADPSMFKLPSHSLEIGVEYEFRADVTDSVGYSSFATQVVTVESSSLIAAVAGGNSTVSAGIDLVLDMTATIDPDEEDGVCQDCFYNVSCTGTLSGSACGLTLPDGETSNGALTFLAEELVSGETYTIQISSRRSTETTWSTTSTFFTVGTEEPMPILSITPLSVEKVNADTVVAIEAEITLSEDSSAIAEWTLTDGVLNGYDELRLAASSSLEYTGYGSNSTLIALVYALDALGAASRATFGVTVSAYEGGVEELSTLVEAVATEALAAGDTDTVMQVLDVASSSLNAANCTVAPDCAALNRDDCGTDGLREDNTCGECVSGFTGVVGPHNSLCVDTTALDATCSDGEKNGDETDVDCGGSSCSPCPSGSTCLVDTDCSYNNCPAPASTTSDPICVSPAKACPNDCGGTIRGTCEYVSSTSGAVLTAADCLADTPTSTCRASCNCFDGYGGDGCQYSDSELDAAVETREQSLLYIQESAESLDISRDTISRQAVLLSKLSVVPQEMKASSVTLVLDLATETTHMADESGQGVASTAAFAVVEIIGQVTLASSFLEEESNMEGLSDVVGSLISAQVAGKVVGEVADEVPSDYFRLSTGIYDAATVGEIQISPPLTADDESVGRSVSSIGLPSDVGDAFSDVSSMSLAVAEWIIDPRQTGNSTSSGDSSNEVVSSVVRFYADPIESSSSLSRRKLKGLNGFGGTSMLAEEERWRGRPRRRSLLEDIGSLETREVECSNNGTEPECASWQGSEESSSAENCQVSSFNDSWTICLCSYAATVGVVGDGTGSNQVDFASTFLDTAGEFISIWDEATTLTWTEVQSAAPIFATMGGILALAVISAGFGWRLDQKDRGRPAGCGAWLASLACWSKAPPSTTDNQGKTVNERRASTLHVPKRGMTRDECLKSLAAAVQGDNKDDVDATAPHHLGERRVRKSLKLLIMVHHDFVSVFYCYYEWFTRPQRVALLLCSVVTLMATEATVFASIMFKDDGTCGAFENLADCAASSTANVNVGGVGSSCAWDEGSRTCYLPEPEEDMETSLVISTISLILALPLELFLVAVFAAFLVRPTKTKGGRAGTGDMEAERGGKAPNGKSGGSAIASSKTVDHVEKDATGDFKARLTIEVDLARAAEHRREGKVTRFWRSLCCGCGFCGDGAKREARLEKKVKRSLGPAISLEKRIAQTGDVDSKEALLFEQAEADSLTYLERQVFFNSRILTYGDEDSLSGVPLCIKCLAWLFIVVYAVGLSFYVCLFAVKAGRATSVQWMISFWVAFFEDIFLLVPLKLAFVYLFLPSLMRHRMRSDMFKRIPRHATSVQVARRHPNMEVSGMILQGRIPHGNEFEKFIPLFTARSRWYTCMTGLVFTVLAIIMLLPDTLQAMIKKEKKLRKARVTQGAYSTGNGMFSGVNVLARGRTAGGRTPNFNTPSPGLNIVAGDAGFESDQQSPTMNTVSLARWVSAVKPGSVQPPQVDQQTESPPRPPRARHGRTNSVASIGMISEAGSRWDNHGRLDSCAASAWGEVHVSDVESSVNEDGGNGDDESSAGTGPRFHGRDHSGRSWNLEQNEWDGLGNTLSLENSVDLGTTASSTFFDDLGEPSHRANVHSRSRRGNSYEDNEESKSPERSPGSIAETRAAGRTSSSSRYDHSRRRVKAAARGDRDGDGSPRRNAGSDFWEQPSSRAQSGSTSGPLCAQDEEITRAGCSRKRFFRS
ncbi:conserved unknown protein [Ectocarpus siliculosus]|uniref:PKD/REJ-like domain-containing protein n=1 Tax=Ectocarpus siliculosus TaxID=2880 RepID=D7G6U0_ECTSI|nr:conserved unknown protein [Ectocarpus siliculosus]|eukprot:CBJ25633.1 conserved unknown protein [Ectocarpus siliculosus]